MKKNCKYCFGKGYYSQLKVINYYGDFGEGSVFDPARIVFRRCPKCRSRKKIPKDILVHNLVS